MRTRFTCFPNYKAAPRCRSNILLQPRKVQTMICNAEAGLPIIAAVGLDFEAAVARSPGVDLAIGLNRKTHLKALREKAAKGSLGIISFGIAGGLSPSLRPGDAVIAMGVMTSTGRFDTCPVWSAALSAALPRARQLPVYGSERPLLTVSDKRALWLETGAAVVDMESRDAAMVAAEHGLPLAVLRVVLELSAAGHSSKCACRRERARQDKNTGRDQSACETAAGSASAHPAWDRCAEGYISPSLLQGRAWAGFCFHKRGRKSCLQDYDTTSQTYHRTIC